MTITRDHTPNTAVPFYGHGIECLDMNGHLRTIPGTVPLSPRKPVKPSCEAVVRGDGEPQDSVGKYDKSLHVDAPAAILPIEASPPGWWERKYGDYPHAVQLCAVKKFFGLAPDDSRSVVLQLPKSRETPARYDIFIVHEYFKEKGVI